MRVIFYQTGTVNKNFLKGKKFQGSKLIQSVSYNKIKMLYKEKF